MRVDGGEDAALARHVVRARRDGAEGRAAQHELFVAEADLVRQVRVAAAELLDFHRAADAELLAQVRLEPRPVELLARADRARVGGGAHFTFIMRRRTFGGKRRSRTAWISLPPTRTSGFFFTTASMIFGAASSGSMARWCVSSIVP